MIQKPVQKIKGKTANLNYYLGLFTVKSWEEFLRHGAHTMGFTDKKKTSAGKLQAGDLILCYLSKVSAFVGILEVTGPAFSDNRQIWSDGLFPVRLPVRTAVELPLSHAIPMNTLRGHLSFLPKEGSKYWSIHVRTSPKLWKKSDGKIIFARLEKRLAEFKARKKQPLEMERISLATIQSAKIPTSFPVGRIIEKTRVRVGQGEAGLLGSYDKVLSFNKVTGYSVNLPIALTCRPSGVCMKTCYFTQGAPSWAFAIQHQRKVYETLVADPYSFADRVALEYDQQKLTFLRWNGGGDLFPESVQAINYLGRVRPDIVLWVVTRIPEYAAQIEHHKNIYVHFSLDRTSMQRREQTLKLKPKSNNLFFSYQGDTREAAPVHAVRKVSVVFFDCYQLPDSLEGLPPEIVCPLNGSPDIANTCEGCRRCFDGSAVKVS
jgi:hypothetical protein